MASSEANWYIVKEGAGQCQIISQLELDALEEPPSAQWGPFESKGGAIAKRVGLIRAGKCQPS